jgi:glycosyltransferase involved in cell wall biosynthesis
VRIVHFTDTYLPRRDGVITSLRTLVTAQREAGCEPLTVVPRHPDQPDEKGIHRLRAVPLGLADLRVSPWILLRGAAGEGTVRRVADHRPDVIHVHTPGPVGLLGVLAARRLGLPLVQTYHTDLHAYAEAYRFPVRALRVGVRLYAHRLDVPRPRLRPPDSPAARRRRRAIHRLAAMDAYNHLLLGDADAVIVPTPAVLERTVLPVPDDRLFVVPTGVAPRPTRPQEIEALRATFGLTEHDRIVLFVGRVNREKGIDLLVPAFERVLGGHPEAVLMLVGAVYEPRWFASLVRSAGPRVARRIVLARQQPPRFVAAAYGAAEVFAFPSHTDTQALVLQEAALAGLPSVLADPVLHRIGPLGGRGVLTAAQPDSFADAITALLDEPRRARAIGAACAEWAARHTPEQYQAAVGDVYRYACSRAGSFNTRGRTRR